MHENDNKGKVSTATIKISCVIYLFYSFHDWQLNILLLFHMKMFDWMVHSCIAESIDNKRYTACGLSIHHDDRSTRRMLYHLAWCHSASLDTSIEYRYLICLGTPGYYVH